MTDAPLDLPAILAKHKDWVLGKPTGQRADLRPDGMGAQGAGDFVRTVAKIRSSGFDDTEMFLDLPDDDEQPRSGEQAGNEQAMSCQLHFGKSLARWRKKTMA